MPCGEVKAAGCRSDAAQQEELLEPFIDLLLVCLLPFFFHLRIPRDA